MTLFDNAIFDALDQKDFDFTSEDLAFASSLHVGDTIYYESSLHDMGFHINYYSLSEQVKRMWNVYSTNQPIFYHSLQTSFQLTIGMELQQQIQKLKLTIRFVYHNKVAKPKQLEFSLAKVFYSRHRDSTMTNCIPTHKLNNRRFLIYYLIKHSYLNK